MPLAEHETARTACARGLLRAGVDEESGEPQAVSVLTERVGWAVALTTDMVTGLLAVHWNAVDVAVLTSGKDGGGRKLPSNAWMALRRLGWTAAPPEGTCANDRIVRMAQEQAGRTLRSAQWRAELVAGVLGSWPADPSRRTADEWVQVRAAVPGGQHVSSGVIKRHTRQIATFLKANGRLPADVFELESAPRTARMLLLSACDGQQAGIERADVPDRALLRLQLPTRPDPRSYRDWTWVACPVILPPTVPARAVLHLPTLRLDQGRVRVDLAYTHAVPKAARTGHTVALGVDWGLNTLLSCGAARLHDDGRITTPGAGAMFRAAGVLAKQHRLRRQGERLQAKADRYRQLTGGDEQHALTARHAILNDEIHRVAARRSNLNEALAWAAARWAVDQAVTAGASVIYVEDLRSMEARGMGRTHNTRMAQTVRGQHHRRMQPPCHRGGHRRGHRASEEHLQALPAVPCSAAAPQGPRRAHRPRLEVGTLPRLRLAGGSGSGRLAAHCRQGPGPPGQDGDRSHHGHHGHPHHRGQARSGRCHHTRRHRPDLPAGPVQERPHPAQADTSGAQATPDTLPCRAFGPGRPASGGTRSQRTGSGCPAQPVGTRA